MRKKQWGRGVLDLMQKLSNEYGVSNRLTTMPFRKITFDLSGSAFF
jgi:hypothetical protein